MFHSIVFISGPCASRPAHIRFRSVFPVGETDVRLPPPDVCRTRTPDRLAPGAAPCRVRVFPFPERIRPSALLTGCPAVRTPPPVDTALRPAGPIRPTAKRTAPSPNRIRPLRATARSVRCVSAVSRVILRSLPASEREGALRRIPPPHRGGRQPILTARPRNTGCTARPPMHGPRCTDLGAPNPEHASRHARSPGGGPSRAEASTRTDRRKNLPA